MPCGTCVMLLYHRGAAGLGPCMRPPPPPPPPGFERYWCRVSHQQVSLEKTVQRQRRQFFFILCVYTQNTQNFVQNSYLC